jgi:hypothetical protein
MRGLDSFYLDYYEAVNRDKLFDKPRDVGTAISAIMMNTNLGNVRIRDAHHRPTATQPSQLGAAQVNLAQNKSALKDVADSIQEVSSGSSVGE